MSGVSKGKAPHCGDGAFGAPGKSVSCAIVDGNVSGSPFYASQGSKWCVRYEQRRTTTMLLLTYGLKSLSVKFCSEY